MGANTQAANMSGAHERAVKRVRANYHQLLCPCTVTWWGLSLRARRASSLHLAFVSWKGQLHAAPLRPLTLGALRGAPQKGSAETSARRRGKPTYPALSRIAPVALPISG
jgi:hypothetical protein